MTFDDAASIDYRALFARTPAPCLVLTPEFVICEVNDAYLEATGRTREELLGRFMFDAFPDNPADPHATGARNLRASLERARDSGKEDVMPVQRYDIPTRSDGGHVFEERYWSPVNTPVLGPGGRTALLIHHVDDVTETFRAQEQLAASERRFRALVENASDLIVVVSLDGKILYASPSVARTLGDAADSMSMADWGARAHPEDRGQALDLIARAQSADPGETVSARLRVLRSDAGVRWMEMHATSHLSDGAIGGIVINVRDVTEQQEAELTLQQQALQDPLTGLPNRRWFADAARGALARGQRTGRFVGLVVLDVDHFKRVNDSLGHPAGDRLLVELARRVRRALRPGDAVARLGGDEFVVLAEELHDKDDALTVARRVSDAATGRYALGADLGTRVTVSVGVSAGGASVDADALFSEADAALYEAKRAGRDRISVFDPAMRVSLSRRMYVERDLHRAISTQQFVLHWQPIVDVRDGAPIAAEALLRWQHPRRGLLTPAQFLPVAEEAGLMDAICRWVLDETMAQAAKWQGLPRRPLVFVNLAAHQLGEPDLLERISGAAAAHGVDPANVRLEVSERVLAADIVGAGGALRGLRDRGFGIALDDFGAGNTSLAWLQDLPIDVLKLDRRFTASIGDAPTRAIVAALTRLAPALGVASLAEGIETPEQLQTLSELGCDYAQGFHISRPAVAEEITELLASRPRRRFTAASSDRSGTGSG